MDASDLRKIVKIMNDNDLVEVEIENEGQRMRVRKAEAGAPAIMTGVPASYAAVPAPAPAAAPGAAPAEEGAAAPAGDGLKEITAPMVGTFYRAPSPEAENYMEIGQRVSPDSVVCILEAMKVMNEIKAECSGEIVEICVQNAEAVEYGQVLFKVKA
ncbi:MAG: acetyl-CoA carboxylase biotin carboxyl carrier protein [Planctomycetota bacterium]|jgi:acetyl-CoA carboxylase biotin carboxyl carrier protein